MGPMPRSDSAIATAISGCMAGSNISASSPSTVTPAACKAASRSITALDRASVTAAALWARCDSESAPLPRPMDRARNDGDDGRDASRPNAPAPLPLREGDGGPRRAEGEGAHDLKPAPADEPGEPAEPGETARAWPLKPAGVDGRDAQGLCGADDAQPPR